MTFDHSETHLIIEETPEDHVLGYICGKVIERCENEPSWANVTFAYDKDGPAELTEIVKHIPWGAQSSYVRSFPLDEMPAVAEILSDAREELRSGIDHNTMEAIEYQLERTYLTYGATVSRTRGRDWRPRWWE